MIALLGGLLIGALALVGIVAALVVVAKITDGSADK